MTDPDLSKTGRRKFLKTAAATSAGTVAAAGVLNGVSPSVWKEQMVFDGNRSYWSRVFSEPGKPLEKDVALDVAVVGGGFTGLSAAYYLKQADPQLRVGVFEARCCGNGASGRNGAMLLTMTEDRYMGWNDDPVLDKRLYELTVDNIERLKTLSKKTGIDAEIEQNGALQVCNTDELAQQGRDFIQKTEAADFPFQFWNKEKILGAIGTSVYPGALFDPNSGQVHPGKLVEVFKSAALSVGTELYEMSPIAHIEPGEPTLLITESGRSVKVKRVILATNAFTSKLGYLRGAVSPLFEYVGITAPLSDEQLKELGWRERIPFNDSRTEVFYLGLTTDNRIHIGGGPAEYVFNNGVHEPSGAEQRFGQLHEELVRIYPQLVTQPFEITWTGIVDYSLAQTPSVGRLPDHENFYYAIGFSGHGVNLTSVFGRILADVVQGRDQEWKWLPYLNRLTVYIPNEPFRWIGVQLATGYYRARDPKTP